jgi:hypothetical protein
VSRFSGWELHDFPEPEASYAAGAASQAADKVMRVSSSTKYELGDVRRHAVEDGVGGENPGADSLAAPPGDSSLPLAERLSTGASTWLRGPMAGWPAARAASVALFNANSASMACCA